MASIVERFRYSHLLGMLVILLVGGPFLASIPFYDVAVTDLLLPITFVLAILACARRTLQAWIGISLLVTMQAARFAARLDTLPWLDSGYPVLAFAFITYISGLILHKVFFGTNDVTTDTIVGSIAVYLMMGLAWAFSFLFLEQAQPGSFLRGDEPLAGSPIDVYVGFSFVTLTTLGYGNIHPVTDQANALAYSEAIFGQLYLTILVARLIGMHLAQGRSEPSS